MSSLDYFVTCPRGVEYSLGDELQTLGLELVRNAPSGVWVRGSLQAGYRACLWSRLANRVILHLADVPADTAEQLYEGALAVDWSAHLSPEGSLLVDFVGRSDVIRNSQFGAQKVKDAVVDTLRTADGRRPSVNTREPDLVISARMVRGRLQLGIDLSGDSLHRRGYRREKGAAPLKENLAAALLVRAGWPEIAAAGGHFIDPLCGSGTLVIEAAMMALDQAPGLRREQFGFSRWLGHQPEVWQALVEEARQRAQVGHDNNRRRFIGYDQDAVVIATAWRNLERAGLEKVVHLECRSVEHFHPEGLPDNASGLVLTNPPYGERLSERKALGALYQALGEGVKSQLPGWRLGVFTGIPEAGHAVGLRSYRQYNLYNGKLPAQLLLFAIDKGSETRSRELLDPSEVVPRIRNEERAAMLKNRLRKNRKTIGQWARKQDIECYRLYDADMPEFALAIDCYQDRVHVQEYQAPKSVDAASAMERLAEALAVIPEALEIPPEAMVLKQRQRQSGLKQYEKQSSTGEFFTVFEHGVQLRVNLRDYLDTGLFLDHRPIRRWIQQQASGLRFLNLFCYTGVATAHAVLGGASRSLSLDLSKTYVNWAKENLALNQADTSVHEVRQTDCLAWLAEKPREMFDLIFLDPPTFSNSARTENVLDIQRDHGHLIQQAMARLTPNGKLIFSNNFRRFRMDSEVESEFEVEDITSETLDRDFQRNARIHRCWLIRHRAI